MATGLRERKKAETRQRLADTAAALFAERGYDRVAVIDVARAAGVSEQTVYNYFPTKESLAFDRSGELGGVLMRAIRERPAGVTPAGAIRPHAIELIERIGTIAPDRHRGGLAYLIATSRQVRQRSLELVELGARAMAEAIAETGDAPPAVAWLQGQALASITHTILSETGRRLLDGETPAEIAPGLAEIISAQLDEIERWEISR